MGDNQIQSQTEAQLQAEIALAFNRGATRLYKNVGGNFWQGTAVTNASILSKVSAILGKLARFTILLYPRRVKAGLVTGAADRIGFHQITITPEMVGKTVAVFAAIELKTVDGSATPEQKQFLKVIQDMGGIAGIARSVDDVNIIFHNFVKKISC